MKSKQWVRVKFNAACLERDNFHCVLCPKMIKQDYKQLEVHHITNRNDMPNGGYVKENGITLCPEHHLMAEEGFPSADSLYRIIRSSYERALDSSKRLC